MKKGYYIDKENRVLGYWEVPEIPADSADHKWIESDVKPKLHVFPPTKEQEIAEKKLALSITDYKILKKLEKLLPSDDVDVLERQEKRDRINQLEQGA